MRSDTTMQPLDTSPSVVSPGQFVEMRIMLSSFLGQKQKTTRTAFCNYLASEVEVLEDKGFQTFRNEAVKLLSSIQTRADEREPSAPPATSTDTFTKLKCNFNICATNISTTTATSTSCTGIHVNHPRDSDAFKPGHPICSEEPSGNQRTAATSQMAANCLPGS